MCVQRPLSGQSHQAAALSVLPHAASDRGHRATGAAAEVALDLARLPQRHEAEL